MSRKYEYMQIELASPEMIRSWSYGEVLKHETINYRTLKPEKDGLFCEVIFGPSKDYQCACGKSKRNVDKGKKCAKCGVEITESKVRRERMGHIELAAPVVHTWYLKNSPSRLAILLEMKTKDLEEIVYLAAYVVIDPGNTQLFKGQILSEQEYSIFSRQYGNTFKALTGAEAVKKLLEDINLQEEFDKLRLEVKTATKQKRDKVIKRLAVVESFLNSNNKPEWMVLDVLPVIPPDLRPMVQLDGGRFATTDLNDLYRRILNRNNRLKRQFEQGAPSLITKNEKRMLQEAVDALIDNGKRGKKVVVEKNRPLKSLSDMLRGKQGRFRQNLLGKRVDYSGRSVIVVGPDLKMYQCGIPREMAITLFKPFVIRELILRELASNIKNAKRMIERHDDRIWNVLEDVIQQHPVLLNRAPTLHRLGIQAFEPKLVEGKAIRLHPLVTPAFNADFDGDQMAVHVPLSLEAQAEARVLMLASNNILNPKDGKPVVTPSQDMVLGNFYLTIERAGEPGEGKVFKNMNEVELAYENGEITLHSRIGIDANYIGIPLSEQQKKFQYLRTTYGKLVFNSILPKGFPYINEPTTFNLTEKTPEKYFMHSGVNVAEEIKKLEVVEAFKKKFLGQVISQVFKVFKVSETSRMLDKMKDLGFYYSTIAGITVSASDVMVVENKKEVLEEAEGVVRQYEKFYDRGLITEEEKKTQVIKIWKEAKDQLEAKIKESMVKDSTNNHIYMMADSGARGNSSNFTQLAGMRGLMAKPSGETMEIPIKSSFREGLTMAEFFTSTHGARKGSTDTALKTADSGYLTRRLVDVAQDVIIVEEDCETEEGVVVEAFVGSDERNIEPLYDRIAGRYANADVIHPETGEVIVAKGKFINNQKAEKIIEVGITAVSIRSALTCESEKGICGKCYGRNLATGEAVEIGEAVGTIAAQSIGEPGTQLTMRTFHTGGVAGADITQGLPRIQELFEAREPKGKAIISEIDGEITDIFVQNERREVHVANELESKKYLTDSGVAPIVAKGDKVIAGQRITDGSISPKQLLRVSNRDKAQQYILKEVQKVYRAQGVEISDKHIEIIINQMMRKVLIIDEGDTELLPGVEISIADFNKENLKVFRKGLKPAVGRPLLLGITRASLRSDSFLSAASFQETTRVLTDSAIKGKIDKLRGLKENVIIGGLIPAGTGVVDNVGLDFSELAEEEEPQTSDETPQSDGKREYVSE